MGIEIVGTGMYLPEKIATNKDFEKIVDTSDEWIVKRTGIKKRHFSQGEYTFSMGEKAARKASEESEDETTAEEDSENEEDSEDENDSENEVKQAALERLSELHIKKDE